jgi:hypothetical protein
VTTPRRTARAEHASHGAAFLHLLDELPLMIARALLRIDRD